MAEKPSYEELEQRIKELENGTLTPKQSEEALHRSTGRFRRLFEQASDAFFIHDFNNGKIIDANKSACKHLGYTRDELLELNISDIEISDSPAAIVENCNRVKKGDPFIDVPCWT
jgi:PAS domain-containing protein